MAGVATAYSTDALTSSGGADNEKWEFAVPLNNEGIQHSSKPRNSHESSSARAISSRNRNSNGSRSSSVSRNVHAYGRRDHSMNRHGSELGSVQDDPSSRKELGEGQDGSGFSREELNENWIHRDKLAKIESEELHQAAILFQRRMRAESKSSAGRGRSHDSHQSGAPASVTSPAVEHSEPWPELQEEPQKDQDTTEANHNADADADGDDVERKNWDLRRPEEIAADEAAGKIYGNPTLRKSSSRIPISTASPVPLVPGRDSRGARSRAPTDELDDEATRGRRASEPATADAVPTTPSPTSRPGSRGTNTAPISPTKKTPAKTTGSTVRKTSAPPTNRKTTAARSRAVSGSQRPPTRSGETRPTTAVNTPEGDPPWLAGVYKPDPRLPPDQQMLPTLAKKMQQEQWEKEGRTATAYDRDFAPLIVNPNDVPPVPPKKEEPAEPPTEEKPKSPEPPRPNTSTGYSTMPKLQDTPPLELTPNLNWNPPVVSVPAEEPPKEKGCGCCIVM